MKYGYTNSHNTKMFYIYIVMKIIYKYIHKIIFYFNIGFGLIKTNNK